MYSATGSEGGSRPYLQSSSSSAGAMDALCSLPEDVQELLIIHWTAMHPVPLPQ